jgi:hypothetical protein
MMKSSNVIEWICSGKKLKVIENFPSLVIEQFREAPPQLNKYYLCLIIPIKSSFTSLRNISSFFVVAWKEKLCGGNLRPQIDNKISFYIKRVLLLDKNHSTMYFIIRAPFRFNFCGEGKVEMERMTAMCIDSYLFVGIQERV